MPIILIMLANLVTSTDLQCRPLRVICSDDSVMGVMIINSASLHHK